MSNRLFYSYLPNIHIRKRGNLTYITVLDLQLLITSTRVLYLLPGTKFRRTWLIFLRRLTSRGETYDIVSLISSFYGYRFRKINPWDLNRIDTNTKRKLFFFIQSKRVYLTWTHLRRVGVYLYMYCIILFTIFYRWCMLFFK